MPGLRVSSRDRNRLLQPRAVQPSISISARVARVPTRGQPTMSVPWASGSFQSVQSLCGGTRLQAIVVVRCVRARDGGGALDSDRVSRGVALRHQSQIAPSSRRVGHRCMCLRRAGPRVGCRRVRDFVTSRQRVHSAYSEVSVVCRRRACSWHSRLSATPTPTRPTHGNSKE